MHSLPAGGNAPARSGTSSKGARAADLHQLLAHRANSDAAQVLAALREGLAPDASLSGPAADLHRLLHEYFAMDDVVTNSTFAQACRRYPDTARVIMQMLQEDGQERIADLLRSLIEATLARRSSLEMAEAGPTQPPAAPATPEAIAEVRLHLGWAAVQESLLNRVASHADHLEFTHGKTHRRSLAREYQLEQLVGAMDLAAMLDELVCARNPRIIARATEWDIARRQAPGDGLEVPVIHRLRKARLGPAAMLGKGTAAAELRSLYEYTNGGDLFIPREHEPREPGLQLVADHDWEQDREQLLQWMLRRGDSDLPDWVHTMVPFAVLQGGVSRWVMPLEGPRAGAVLLSHPDVLENQVRYKSLAHFVAALSLFPHEVVGAGGYVSYLTPDLKHSLYPHGYREDAR